MTLRHDVQAMALDGFCSFVANLALAARIHHQAWHGPFEAPSDGRAPEIWIWIFDDFCWLIYSKMVHDDYMMVNS